MKRFLPVVFLLPLLIVVANFTANAQIKAATPAFDIQNCKPEDKIVAAKIMADLYPRFPAEERALVGDGFLIKCLYEEPWASSIVAAIDLRVTKAETEKCLEKNFCVQYTIKMEFNMAPIMLDLARLAYAATDERVAGVIKKIILDTPAHEVFHLMQYMKDPASILIFLSRPEDCPQGICDPLKTESMKRKMENEFEAAAVGYAAGSATITQEDWEYTVSWLRARPELLGRRLKALTENSFADIHEPMSAEVKMFYESMYLPVILARSCAENPSAFDAEDKRIARIFLNKRSKWQKIYPYLPPVFDRLETCVGK